VKIDPPSCRKKIREMPVTSLLRGAEKTGRLAKAQGRPGKCLADSAEKKTPEWEVERRSSHYGFSSPEMKLQHVRIPISLLRSPLLADWWISEKELKSIQFTRSNTSLAMWHQFSSWPHHDGFTVVELYHESTLEVPEDAGTTHTHPSHTLTIVFSTAPRTPQRRI